MIFNPLSSNISLLWIFKCGHTNNFPFWIYQTREFWAFSCICTLVFLFVCNFSLSFHLGMVGMNKRMYVKVEKQFPMDDMNYDSRKYVILHYLMIFYSTHASISSWEYSPINPLTNIQWLRTKSIKCGCIPFKVHGFSRWHNRVFYLQ